MDNALTIAIDGPAASGKGTLARKLAKHLGIPYLDTGSLYRAVALKLLSAGQHIDDAEAAHAACTAFDAALLADPRLRGEEVGQAASIVSAMPRVREALLQYQRDFARGGAVLDGRDIGTVVLPDARIKLYLTASLEARSRRRYEELRQQEGGPDYAAVLTELAARDARDAARTIAPMKPAGDAIIVDTSSADAEQVFKEIAALVEQARQQA